MSDLSASPVGTWGRQGRGLPHLTLSDDGRLSGSDGCNRLAGGWTLDDGAVKFGPLVSTLLYCEGVDTWLRLARSATVEGNTMHVRDDEGREIGTLDRC